MHREKRIYTLLLFGLVLILFGANYSFLDSALARWYAPAEGGIVERVIDGDTLVINGTSIRILGINTPEKGELYSAEAKAFLENLTLDKFVTLARGKDDTDLYHRKLRYIFVGATNVNRLLVSEGYANYYFPSGKDQFYSSFTSAWQECLTSEKRLCEPSRDICSSCIELETFDVSAQTVVFKNSCATSCDLSGWDIKDEGRKHFTFSSFQLGGGDEVAVVVGNGTDFATRLFWRGETYVWTKSGDTLFLRDNEGGLVLWEGY